MKCARSLATILLFMALIGGCAAQLPETISRTYGVALAAVPGW